ncbi:MAG: hypothetical protein Tsb0018_06930 [Opitutales bacterium]
MKKPYFISALAIAILFALATLAQAQVIAGDDSGKTPPNNNTPDAEKQAEAKALAKQYAAGVNVSKQINDLLAKADTMSQSEFEKEMQRLLNEAKAVLNEMKDEPTTREQRRQSLESIKKAQTTLNALKSGQTSFQSTKSALKKVQLNIVSGVLPKLASFAKNGKLLKFLVVYLENLGIKIDNSLISPEV